MSPIKTLTLLSLIFLSLFHLTLSSTTIGINYGRLGNNLPPPRQAVALLTSMNIAHIKLYDADSQILSLLSKTPIDVSIMVPNRQIASVAANQSHADQWVKKYITSHYPNTKIRTLLVGNEVFTSNDINLWLNLVPAMQNLRVALHKNNIHNIKIGTPLAMDAIDLDSSFPPSNARFRPDIPLHVILPLLRFLKGTSSYYFVDVYPYLAWLSNPTGISLDFALLQGNATITDSGSGLVYTNLLDQMLDSVHFAMKRLGYDSVRIAIAETGWPHAGDIDEPGANIYNAETYIRNLMKKLTSKPRSGTPARPKAEIPAFLFSLFDENQKPGPGTERNWGILDNNGRPVYEVDLSGTSPVNNEPVQLPGPLNNEPYRGKIWCVASSDAGLNELSVVLETTCDEGSGACDELAPGKGCYEPVSVFAHASYAFSSYWATHRKNGVPCYFNGLAVETITDPSHGSCKFPSVVM